MSDTQYTPGPWENDHAIIKSEYEGTSTHIHEVAAVFATRTKHLSESEANARLIAAAPDFKESTEPELLDKASKILRREGHNAVAQALGHKADEERQALNKYDGNQ